MPVARFRSISHQTGQKKRTPGLYQLITMEQCKRIVDWLHSRKLEFYLESNNGLFASEHFEDKAFAYLKLIDSV